MPVIPAIVSTLVLATLATVFLSTMVLAAAVAPAAAIRPYAAGETGKTAYEYDHSDAMAWFHVLLLILQKQILSCARARVRTLRHTDAVEPHQ